MNKMVLLFLTSIVGSSCGQSKGIFDQIDPTLTRCRGEAQIAIGDGFLKNLCGCSGVGENQTIYKSGERLTCTLESGIQKVVFHFVGGLRHQIAPEVPGAFPATQVIDATTSARTQVITFPNSSFNYGFIDNYNTALRGEIIIP